MPVRVAGGGLIGIGSDPVNNAAAFERAVKLQTGEERPNRTHVVNGVDILDMVYGAQVPPEQSGADLDQQI